MLQENQTRRKNREKLTSEDKTNFRRYLKSFLTLLDASEALGISTVTINKIKSTGIAHPNTLATIREKCSPAQA